MGPLGSPVAGKERSSDPHPFSRSKPSLLWWPQVEDRRRKLRSCRVLDFKGFGFYLRDISGMPGSVDRVVGGQSLTEVDGQKMRGAKLS